MFKNLKIGLIYKHIFTLTVCTENFSLQLNYTSTYIFFNNKNRNYIRSLRYHVRCLINHAFLDLTYIYATIFLTY